MVWILISAKPKFRFFQQVLNIKMFVRINMVQDQSAGLSLPLVSPDE
jgi:hypothetical protein